MSEKLSFHHLFLQPMEIVATKRHKASSVSNRHFAQVGRMGHSRGLVAAGAVVFGFGLLMVVLVPRKEPGELLSYSFSSYSVQPTIQEVCSLSFSLRSSLCC